MSDERETIADIVAEKRRRADEIERDVFAKMKSGEMVSDLYAREVIENLRREADRIEAAWSCEMQSLQGTIVKMNNALAEKQELSANSKSAQIEFGNAAAIREALVRCADIINKFGLAEIVKTPMEVICDIEGIINAALSAPPRNCDVGTAKKQNDRYVLFCKSHKKNHGNCFGCTAFQFIGRCEFAWAQMPYEEGENDGEVS